MIQYNFNYYRLKEILLFLFSLLFCDQIFSADIYINNENSYEIHLPENWVHKEEDANYLLIKRPDSFGYNCSLLVEENTDLINHNLEELVKYIKYDLFQKDGESVTSTIEKLEEVDLNSVPAVKLFINTRLKKNKAEELKTEPRIIGKDIGMYTINNNKSYYLNCSGTVDEYENNISNYEYIVGSFNFLNEK